ncbi:MAG: GNAT family N-acetyltransferase [Clostridiales bacterium]
MFKVINKNISLDFKKITSDFSPSFSGIVSGICKGDLWIDNLKNPKLALAKSYSVGGFAIFGEMNNTAEIKKFEEFLRNDLFKELKAKNINCFEFSIENNTINIDIHKLFYDKSIKTEKEFSFRKSSIINEKLNLPDGYNIYKVNYDFWNNVSKGIFQNTSFLTKRLLESWNNFDDFYNNSLAFCILYQQKVVAVILGTAMFKNYISIDIETEKLHRCKNLAYLMTVNFVNSCIKKGLVAQWDCVESNKASYKLAKKAGFHFIRENIVYYFDI